MRYKKIEGAEKLTRFLKPMLAQLTDIGPFDDKDWLFEIKWDGFRAISEVHDRQVKLYSRNGLSFLKAYRKVADALGRLKNDVVLDGEIVVFDEHNKPSFQKLQNYSNESKYSIHYFVFDILELDGRKLVDLPLIERKTILKDLFPKPGVIQYCDHVLADGLSFFIEIQKSGLEGMIAKRISSTYQMGKRNTDWLKIKNVMTDEAVIVGFTEPKGSRIGFGSLLLAQYVDNKLHYVGNVGTGFTDEILKDLYKKLIKLRVDESPLDARIKPPAHTTWVRPEFVCNIKFTEKTSDGIFRHPVYLGLRPDKKVKEAKPETAVTINPKSGRRKVRTGQL